MNQFIPLGSNFRIVMEELGEEREPVVVIDNFLSSAHSLVDYASQAAKFDVPSNFYPGIRAECPKSYVNSLAFHLGACLQKVFGVSRSDWNTLTSYFSLVTTPPSQLSLKQQIPHFDVPFRNGIALVHFLCNESKGGTSFYRHSSTAFEYVDTARVDRYFACLHNELNELSETQNQKQYINGDSRYFSRIASYPAAFNRCLIYRSSSLHSGDITSNFDFSPTPKHGRLTITSFLQTNEK